jgi:iron complex outermembrane receptor protein
VLHFRVETAVPIAISTATSAQLSAVGASSVSDLKLIVPGADVLATNGYISPFIRGVGSRAIGPGVENPIAVYVDGVYYANAASSLFSFNNIEQVAVLKGPQGTLFGRNATGGLLQVTTRDPGAEAAGEASISYGNYDTARVAAYLTGAVATNLAADIAVQYSRQGDGYGTNLTNGRDVYRVYHDIGVRSKLLWTIGDATEARLALDFSDQRNNLNAQRVLPGATTPANLAPNFIGDARDIATDVQPMVSTSDGGASLKIDHDFGSTKLVSITAYRRSRFQDTFDFDVTSAVFRSAYVDQRDRQFSQELQLQSSGSGPVQWLIGGYYFDARATYQPLAVRSFNAAVSPATQVVQADTLSVQRGESLAGFGQATWEVANGFHLTGGLRYTSEKRQLDASIVSTRANATQFVSAGPVDLSSRFKKLTWRLSADYQFSAGTLGYLSYNRGFKSGGFNPGTLTLPAFTPEVLDAYEGGVKTTLFDRRLRFNTAIFYYDYKKVQVQRVVVGGTGSTSGIANGAKAEFYGGEAEITAQPIPQLLLTAGYQYLHGRYKTFQNAILSTPNPAGGEFLLPGNASGNDTVVSPKSQINASATYTIPVGTSTLRLSSNYYHNSGYFAEPDNVLRQPAYSLFGASAAFSTAGDHLTVSLWGTNLGNKLYSNYLNHQATGAGVGLSRVSYAAPRTYGVTLASKF